LKPPIPIGTIAEHHRRPIATAAGKRNVRSPAVNSAYNVARPDSLAVRLAGRQRRAMYGAFLARSAVAAGATILDVGVTADRSYDSSNYLEAWYPDKGAIVAVGIDDAAFLERLYPGLRFVAASGLALPFAGHSFDVVHCSAVIEHVGSFERQCRLIAECCRVARRAVFMTTPNRWFPIEVHTVLPLVHWLPKPAFRALMRASGRAFFADEANLNLMTAGELAAAAARVIGFRAEVTTVALAGWPSNLLLSMRRDMQSDRPGPAEEANPE
jgi:hypothetical protein